MNLKELISKYHLAKLEKWERELMDDLLHTILHPTERGYSLRCILVSLYCFGKDSRSNENCGSDKPDG